MDNLSLKNLQLSYQAVYDDSLCESMSELGLFNEARDGYGDDSKFKDDTDAADFIPGKTVPKVKKYGRLSRYAPEALSGERSRTASNVRRSTTSPNQPRAVQIPKDEPKPKMVKKDGKWVKVKEEYEIYNLILEYLLDEGYADSFESAEIILENMSDEWINDVIEEGYKNLPVGKMIRQAGRKVAQFAYKNPEDIEAANKVAKDVRKMSRVGSRHSTVRGKGKIRGEGQALLNRLRGENK